jgi:ABC-type phosphate transport system substrate-binding protein
VAATPDRPAVPPVPAFTYPGQPNAYDANPDGPSNWQDTVTSPDGSGEVAIQLFTRRESAALGCAGSDGCSVVVVPNYGDDQGNGATELSLDAPWAWARRTVVPIHFLPLEVACPLEGKAVDVEGSPMAARLLASWRARTCTVPRGGVRLDYTAIGEPQTRTDVAGNSTDVGLVVDPLNPEAEKDHAIVYAPVAATSLVVAYQIDDAQGRPVRDLKLNARLIAKLITASYRTGANPAVDGNPYNLFHDPEFLALNPGVEWPDGSPGNHPLLLGDISDTTRALTRWIASDPDARAFIAGKPDPWGMHVNANYKNVGLPFDLFPVLDQKQSDYFEPVQELDTLARKVSIAQFPGASTTYEGGVAVITKPPRQNPGSREVIGIIDAASAADFRLSTARLRNSGGAFVGPTSSGVLAGLAHAKVAADGVTRSVDFDSRDKAIYPLSLLVSAATSIKETKAVRTSVNTFLDYVAGAGQVAGDEVGQLPAGYVPLPASYQKLIASAQQQIARGYVAPTTGHSGGGGDDPVDTPTGEAAPTPVTEAPATLPPAVVAPGVTDTVDLVTYTRTDRHPLYRRLLALPVLLGLGVLAALAGPAVAGLRRIGWGPEWLQR